MDTTQYSTDSKTRRFDCNVHNSNSKLDRTKALSKLEYITCKILSSTEHLPCNLLISLGHLFNIFQDVKFLILLWVIHCLDGRSVCVTTAMKRTPYLPGTNAPRAETTVYI